MARIATTLSAPYLVDVSSDGSELLVLGHPGAASLGVGVRVVDRTRGGRSPRRVGDLRADDAAWSSDGRSIAYVTAGSPEVYVASIDGSDSRRIWTAPVGPDGRPGPLMGVACASPSCPRTACLPSGRSARTARVLIPSCRPSSGRHATVDELPTGGTSSSPPGDVPITSGSSRTDRLAFPGVARAGTAHEWANAFNPGAESRRPEDLRGGRERTR